jgi:predicted transcriptional regulator
MKAVDSHGQIAEKCSRSTRRREAQLEPMARSIFRGKLAKGLLSEGIAARKVAEVVGVSRQQVYKDLARFKAATRCASMEELQEAW